MSEKERQFYKEIPLGTGRGSEPKETLPAIEVDNEVIWVNPEFEKMPFNIKEGEPTRLGIFLTPGPKEGEKVYNLKVLEGHGRSGLLGRVIFKDKQGRIYRDIDLKGIGKVEFGKSAKPRVGRVEVGPHETEGILYSRSSFYSYSERDPYRAEEFLKLGIRTERYLALIKLKEIVDENGKKISIEDARKGFMLLPLSHKNPIIGVRALGTKYRISNINDVSLADARMMVSQELGLKEEAFSWPDYLRWFSQTLGENVGLMHKNHLTHGYLLNHNITLDCRIIDLDSVSHHYDWDSSFAEKSMKIDWYKASHGALRKLFNKVSPRDKACKDFSEYLNYFNEDYQKAIGYTPEFLEEGKRKTI